MDGSKLVDSVLVKCDYHHILIQYLLFYYHLLSISKTLHKIQVSGISIQCITNASTKTDNISDNVVKF